eukprot:CAMPEP_0206446222 /NCGR_PEP_ID=MMETSP0324_2-20121206/16002_1 /ASSEMBLY_ACC=CAM_ASM_000836 /TAXON_ID=2866 /ORGANISM="Crypthecodinium cohnii, Strain Seligo" /LENGTH=236 /DNA_ID=CAMNT_0053914641 /DNA_START=74 /DNA_END=784 /DNA_ORIENTATION=-
MFCCCQNDASSKDEAVMVKAFPVTDEHKRSKEAPLGPPADEVKPVEAPVKTEERKAAPDSAEAVKTFVANVTKPTQDAALGWHLDVLDQRHLFICRLITTSNTPLEKYNSTVSSNLQIREGDYVTAVDGVSGSAEKMSEAMKKSDNLSITVARPHLFTKTISKNNMALGLDLKYGPGGSSLLLEGVREGAIKNSTSEVKAGDRIVSVNGITGTPYILMQAIQDAANLEICFSRPSS